MFDGQFKEHNEREVVLDGKSSEAVLELLKYIYPQFNGQITDDNIEHFLQLADEYMIDHLKQPCKELLLRQLGQFKYVLLPTIEKILKPSTKSKAFHASDSALHSSRDNDGHSSGHETSNRRHLSQRPTSTSRHTPTKTSSIYTKHGDQPASSTNTTPRHFIFLDKTRMPNFYNEQKTTIPFTNNELEMWLRRLRILYQIDKGRNYGEVIDSILSILQFVPTNILVPLLHPTTDTYVMIESMLNDISRARLYTLEDWASDGDSHRLVVLPEAYQILAVSNLVAAQETIEFHTKLPENVESSFQSVVTITSDQEEPISSLDTDTD
ncbi:hypothetical protein I4U23_026468 [Adineta vaga]|nr:hypothetical protein I4U23_026468 [Adineta vaga]